MTSWLVFFLCLRGAASLEARARFFLLAISGFLDECEWAGGSGSERLFVAVGRVGGTGAGAAPGAGRGGLPTGRGAFAGGAGGPLDLGLRPAQAGSDLFGHDL